MDSTFPFFHCGWGGEGEGVEGGGVSQERDIFQPALRSQIRQRNLSWIIPVMNWPRHSYVVPLHFCRFISFIFFSISNLIIKKKKKKIPVFCGDSGTLEHDAKKMAAIRRRYRCRQISARHTQTKSNNIKERWKKKWGRRKILPHRSEGTKRNQDQVMSSKKGRKKAEKRKKKKDGGQQAPGATARASFVTRNPAGIPQDFPRQFQSN